VDAHGKNDIRIDSIANTKSRLRFCSEESGSR
jgi:hypothetical protein